MGSIAYVAQFPSTQHQIDKSGTFQALFGFEVLKNEKSGSSPLRDLIERVRLRVRSLA